MVFFLFARLKPQLEREEEVYTADGYVEQRAFGFVSGHDFSRAENVAQSLRALALEGKTLHPN
jgi:hypothetical protein